MAAKDHIPLGERVAEAADAGVQALRDDDVNQAMHHFMAALHDARNVLNALNDDPQKRQGGGA